MPLARQHIHGERPLQRKRRNEGILIREEDIQQFLDDYEKMDWAKETVQFYRRKMKRFYEDLPEDKNVRHSTAAKLAYLTALKRLFAGDGQCVPAGMNG